MANSSSVLTKDGFNINNMKKFPCVTDGKINTIIFLEAASDLITLIEKLGSVFAPVKYDMQGNIDKIKKYYDYSEDSCLLELIKDEKSKGKDVGAEGVLWLNRALFFFELVFLEIIDCLRRKEYDENMKNIFTKAYDGSVRKYHNWVTQNLFKLILKMSPTLPQILKTLEATKNIEQFEINLTKFHTSLHSVRFRIDNYFIENNLFTQT